MISPCPSLSLSLPLSMCHKHTHWNSVWAAWADIVDFVVITTIIIVISTVIWAVDTDQTTEKPSTTISFIELKSNKSYATHIRTKCVCVHGQFYTLARLFILHMYDIWFIWILVAHSPKKAHAHINSPSTQLNADCQHRLNAYYFSHFLIYSDLNRWNFFLPIRKMAIFLEKICKFSTGQTAAAAVARWTIYMFEWARFVHKLILCGMALYTYIKSGRKWCTSAQNAIPFFHDVVMLVISTPG